MGEDRVAPFTAEEWESPNDVIDGFIDMELGIVDVSLGDVAGSHTRPRDARLLAALLLQRAGPDGGPLFTHEMLDAIEQAAGGARVEQWVLWDGSDMATALLAHVAALRSLLPPRDA